MRRIYFTGAVCSIALLGLACGGNPVEDSGSTPQVTSQQPGPQLVEHGQGWEEYQQSLDELTSLKGTIENKYEQLQRQHPAAPGEPVFPGQASTTADEILKICDSLEQGSRQLLDHPYLRQSKGSDTDARDLIRYAQEMREKVQPGG